MNNAVKPYLNHFDFYAPTRIIFGSGVLKTLHQYPMPGKKALICIDRDPFARKLGYVDTLQEQLKLAGCESEVYDKIQPNPVIQNIHEGRDYLKAAGCDFLISLGGGSTHDTAKGIALTATNPGSIWDYILGGSGGCKPVANTPLPIIAISTTAGTGSEVARGMVVTNEETGEKNSLKDMGLFPCYCFEDPEIQASVPPMLTAFQGYDAASHCIEGYLMRKSSLMSDMIALTSVENVSHYLPRAVRNGNDMEARERVAFATILSGWSMNNASTSTLHVIEQELSAFNGRLAHGAGLIMLAQAYYAHQVAIHACDERFVELAKAMGRSGAKEPEEFLEEHAKLIENIGCSNLKMSDYGILPEQFEAFDQRARFSASAMFTQQDRVPLTKDDVINILQKSYQ